MQTSVTLAKGQLTDLVRRAEAGGEVVLTRHGQAVARLVAIGRTPDGVARRALLEAVRRSAAKRTHTGTGAAASQDFLYGKDGLPD